MVPRHLVFGLSKVTSPRKTLLRQCKVMPYAAWMSRYCIIGGKQRQTSWNNEEFSPGVMADSGFGSPPLDV